jgi:hypothetical protein
MLLNQPLYINFIYQIHFFENNYAKVRTSSIFIILFMSLINFRLDISNILFTEQKY